METRKSISQIVKDIDFEIPNNPAGFTLPYSLKQIDENENITPSISDKHISIESSNTDFQQLLEISSQNENDFGDQIFTQYSQSNLDLNEYISHIPFFDEIGINTNITNIFKNYIIYHEKHIYKPLPKTPNQLSQIFNKFNDNINIVVQYQIKIQKLIDSGVINAPNIHFDTLCVPPQKRFEFENVRVKGMAYSKPTNRKYDRSGLNEIKSLFLSKKGIKIMNEINDCKKRLILIIVRNNEYDTNNDILYLFTQKINGNLKDKKYLYNQVLWNINSKKNIKINQYKNIKIDNLFQISYYLHTQNKDKQCKMYMYYNGYGQRIFKDNIKQWHILFANNNGFYNNNKLINEFNDYINNDKCIEYGKYLFGLKYQKRIYKNVTNQRYILHVPKNVLKNDIPNIREQFIQQKNLYYYLMWTCKMQIIDSQFIHYTFMCDDNKEEEIGIFNCELHNKHSNNILYCVCKWNKTNYNYEMISMMTSYNICHKYGINFINDLPIGSRYLHKSFENEIMKNNIYLKYEYIPINNYTKLEIFSNSKSPKSSMYNYTELNKYILESINKCINNEISLIPILQVDLNNSNIYCETLIPIKLPNKQTYIGVSYKLMNNKIQINKIYNDCNDILNKAILINPNAYNSYKYLKCQFSNEQISNKMLLQLNADHTLRIDSLQKELNAALQRENLLLSMLMQKNIYIPTTPITPITPVFCNNNSDSPTLSTYQPVTPVLYNNNSNSGWKNFNFSC